MAASKRGVDQGRATVFAEGYCSHADMAFRFCYALLLNQSNAKKCVQAAFRELAGEFSSHSSSSDSLSLVLTRSWGQCSKVKDSGSAPGKNPLNELFGRMSAEERACLFLADIAGRSASDTALITSLSEEKVRKYLGAARRKMMESSFAQVQLPELQSEEADIES